jgi:hypothetical protein
MGFPQEIHLTPEEEAALDEVWDEIVAETEAKRQQQSEQEIQRLPSELREHGVGEGE